MDGVTAVNSVARDTHAHTHAYTHAHTHAYTHTHSTHTKCRVNTEQCTSTGHHTLHSFFYAVTPIWCHKKTRDNAAMINGLRRV